MSTSWQCFEFFIPSILIYCGKKIRGPGYITVKGMDRAWVEVVEENTFGPHREKRQLT